MPLIIFLGSCMNEDLKLQVTTVKVDSLSQIIMVNDSLVQPVVYTHVNGLAHQPVSVAKKMFISVVLPSVLITKYHLNEARQKIHKLKERERWVPEDSVYYHNLKAQYRATDIENLLKRMSTVPNSIVLAQAAIESGWGQSRFFKEGNNIFGMWSYNSNEPRLRAGLDREHGPVHVRSYADLSESIEDYFKTLGTARAYRGLRTALLETNNPYELLPHLRLYSEKRKAYTDQLRRIIDQNNLIQYDHYRIDPKFLVAP